MPGSSFGREGAGENLVRISLTVPDEKLGGGLRPTSAFVRSLTLSGERLAS